jgi:hypothetical protein
MLERQVKDGCEIIGLDSTNGAWLNEMHLFLIYRDVDRQK